LRKARPLLSFRLRELLKPLVVFNGATGLFAVGSLQIEGRVYLWRLGPEGPEEVSSLECSGTCSAVGGCGNAYVMCGSELYEISEGGVRPVYRFKPNLLPAGFDYYTERLLLASSEEVVVYDPATGSELRLRTPVPESLRWGEVFGGVRVASDHEFYYVAEVEGYELRLARYRKNLELADEVAVGRVLDMFGPIYLKVYVGANERAVLTSLRSPLREEYLLFDRELKLRRREGELLQDIEATRDLLYVRCKGGLPCSVSESGELRLVPLIGAPLPGGIDSTLYFSNIAALYDLRTGKLDLFLGQVRSPKREAR